MAWKPKEKQLSPEEAIEMARRDLAPFWFGSPPLLAGVRGEDGRASVHALDPGFERRAWMLLFADLTAYAGETLLQFAREWTRRYSPYDLGLTLVVRPSYSFISSAKALPPLLRKSSEAFPIVVDHEGLILDAFGGAAGLPRAKLLQQRKILFENSGSQWFEGTELALQKFLRSADPGLPLSPAFEPQGDLPLDVSQLELGARFKQTAAKLSGKITQEPDRVVIADPHAEIRFDSPSARVSLVGASASASHEIAHVRVELNRDPVFDAAAAPDLSFGDDGGSEVKVGDARLYHVLQALPDKARAVTLKFPNADRVPVALYGIRFGR
jgi:hypothetical protein